MADAFCARCWRAAEIRSRRPGARFPSDSSSPWRCFVCGGAVFLGSNSNNLWIMMAGVFLFLAAQLEDRSMILQAVLERVRVIDVMITDFITLSPAETLADALQRSVEPPQEEFPVVRGTDMVGVISRQQMAASHGRGGQRLRAIGHAPRVPGRRSAGVAGRGAAPHRTQRPGHDSRGRRRLPGRHHHLPEPDAQTDCALAAPRPRPNAPASNAPAHLQ